jgi:hypothetical protein
MSFKSKKDSLIHLRRGAAVLAVVLSLCAGGAQADWMSDMGFTQLKAELGSNMVTGAGVSVAQVEAEDGSGNFMPDQTYSDFLGGAVKTITQISQTGSGGVSSHATSVGYCLYGNSNMSPGITTVDVYEATDFLNGQLKYKYSGPAPAPALSMTERVANFSWIGTEGSTGSDTQALRRFDYLLSQNHILATIATNNGSSSTIPTLLTSAYNGITVGRADAQDAHGYTSIDVAGRIAPDIVASGPLSTATSFTTPMVASAATLLYQTADLYSNLSAARNQPEVIKAVLMAGASKTQCPNWTRTPTQPLDTTYGAGELNVYNSYNLLKAGQYAASSSATVNNAGWDYANVTSGSNRYYYFNLTADSAPLSVMLTWDRVITNANPNFWSPTVTVPDLNLKLFGASGFTLGSMIDSSVSAVDNVQCIYQGSLAPGRYALEVSSLSGSANYALAWQSALTMYPTGDFNNDGLVTAADINQLYRNFGANSLYDLNGDGTVNQADVDYLLKNVLHRNYGDANLDGKVDFTDFQVLLDHWQLSGQGWATGDFTGDGTVDFLDFQKLLDNWNPAGTAPSVGSLVPEPGTVALLLAGGVLMILRRQRRRA